MSGKVTSAPSAGKSEYNFTAIPEKLKELHHWVLFKLEGEKTPPDKVPYQLNGQKAKSNDSATWSSFEPTVSAYEAGGYDGTSFALTKDDPYCFVDLDGCRNPDTGEIDSAAQEIISRFKTYSELSPSRTGVHLIGRAKLLAACKVGGIEMYDRLRFMTMTGWHLEGTPTTVEDVQAEADKLWEKLKGKQGGSGGNAYIPQDAIDWGADPETVREELDKLLGTDSQLRRTWEHDRPDLSDQSLSAYDLSLCSQLARNYGWTDPTRLYLVIRLHRAEHENPNKKSKRKDYIRRTIGTALAGLEDDDEEEENGGEDVIKLRPGHQSRVVKKAAALLRRKTLADPYNGFYVRDGLLVHVSPSAEGSPQRAGASTPPRLVVTKATPEALLMTLGELAVWRVFDKRSKGWVRTDPPEWVAQMLLKCRGAWQKIPCLSGIVEAPTLRPDGTVLQQAGYDALTGLLFDPGDVEFPPIPEVPTREEGLAALKTLTDLLREFPFVDAVSRSVAVSGMITPLVRYACGAVPLHGITAPVMGSGKTLLGCLPGYIAIGREPFVTGQAKNAVEEEKRLLALVLECHPIVVFDNLDRELRSSALCRAITGELFADRVLGVTATAQGRSGATFYATGNNLAIAGDLTTRSLLCTLDPNCERPLERKFAVNLRAEVLKRRPELVAAVLTIVLSFQAAGAPDQGVVSLIRFEEWCTFVRNPLIWLGMADPYDSITRLESLDPVREQLGALATAWYAVFGSEAVKVGDAIKAAEPNPYAKPGSAEDDDRKALYEIITELNGRGSISPTAVGKFIRSHEGRIEGALRFEKAGKAQGAIRWRVVAVEGPAQPPSKGEILSGNGTHKNGGIATVIFTTPKGKCKVVTKSKSKGTPTANGGNGALLTVGLQSAKPDQGVPGDG